MQNDHAVFMTIYDDGAVIYKLSGEDGSYIGHIYDNLYFHHKLDISPNDLFLLITS